MYFGSVKVIPGQLTINVVKNAGERVKCFSESQLNNGTITWPQKYLTITFPHIFTKKFMKLIDLKLLNLIVILYDFYSIIHIFFCN